MVDTEMVKRTEEIKQLFETRIFAGLHTTVENRGVVYKTVTGEPWGAYNYYQGNFTSINVFNLDRTVNRHRLLGTLCHEYEHHVANLFAEKCYREQELLDLSAVLLNTKRSVISEGTADCTRDFLGLRPREHGELLDSLSRLQDMVFLNANYMLNLESASEETAAEYVSSNFFIPIEEARKGLAFAKSLTPQGKINLFSPYIYTYFFGKRDYVVPIFKKAKRKGKLKEFFQTLHLNPYSRSSATWAIAFSRI